MARPPSLGLLRSHMHVPGYCPSLCITERNRATSSAAAAGMVQTEKNKRHGISDPPGTGQFSRLLAAAAGETKRDQGGKARTSKQRTDACA
jgi:hypothetical protein